MYFILAYKKLKIIPKLLILTNLMRNPYQGCKFFTNGGDNINNEEKAEVISNESK